MGTPVELACLAIVQQGLLERPQGHAAVHGVVVQGVRVHVARQRPRQNNVVVVALCSVLV